MEDPPRRIRYPRIPITFEKAAELRARLADAEHASRTLLDLLVRRESDLDGLRRDCEWQQGRVVEREQQLAKVTAEAGQLRADVAEYQREAAEYRAELELSRQNFDSLDAGSRTAVHRLGLERDRALERWAQAAETLAEVDIARADLEAKLVRATDGPRCGAPAVRGVESLRCERLLGHYGPHEYADQADE